MAHAGHHLQIGLPTERQGIRLVTLVSSVRKLAQWSLAVLCLCMMTPNWGAAETSVAQDASALGSNGFKKIRRAVVAKRYDQAITLLNEELQKPYSLELRRVLEFGLGILCFRQGRWDEALEALSYSVDGVLNVEDYARFHIGEIYFEKKRYTDARREYEKALRLNPTRQLQNAIRFKLAQIHQDSGDWGKARSHLIYLERKERKGVDYPRILWELIRSELRGKNSWRACQWARKLYSQYPSDPLVSEWTLDLHKSKFEGSPLSCFATLNDQQRRIRRLQWAGYSDWARREIEELQRRIRKSTQFHVDQIMAKFLISEGYVEEALSILARHYDHEERNAQYLNLLAQGAALAGEHDVAVGTYDRAFELSGRGKSGRKALFSAAFLSYQTQDYDGATLRFQKFVKYFASSGLSRDASWYLSWIQYLKGNYSEAQVRFEDLLRSKRRSPRAWKSFSSEKVHYWMAISFLKRGNWQRAKEMLFTLSQDSEMGYYAILAKYRLDAINAQYVERQIASVTESPKKVEVTLGDEVDVSSVMISDEGQRELSEEEESEENMNIGSSKGEDESSDNTAEEESTEGEMGLTTSGMAVTSLENGSSDEVDKGSFSTAGLKNSKLLQRLVRAQMLSSLGFSEWATQDLFEIERRTSHPAHLKFLMAHYEEIESYHRSSHISEIFFRPQMASYGMKGIRYLWEYSYPKAFEVDVKESSQRFNIPQELIWAIMRAESHYRTGVRSPVGAAGLMQLMPHTARQMSKILGERDFDVTQLDQSEVNIKLGSGYLGRLMNKFSNMIPLVAAGYNAGPHRVESWLNSFGQMDVDEFIEHIPFLETRGYVKKVVRNYQIYHDLYSDRGENLNWLIEPVRVQSNGRPSTRESWED